MVREVYGVHLRSVQEKGRLEKMISSGRSSAQAVTRARTLLKIGDRTGCPVVMPRLWR